MVKASNYDYTVWPYRWTISLLYLALDNIREQVPFRIQYFWSISHWWLPDLAHPISFLHHSPSDVGQSATPSCLSKWGGVFSIPSLQWLPNLAIKPSNCCHFSIWKQGKRHIPKNACASSPISSTDWNHQVISSGHKSGYFLWENWLDWPYRV